MTSSFWGFSLQNTEDSATSSPYYLPQPTYPRPYDFVGQIFGGPTFTYYTEPYSSLMPQFQGDTYDHGYQHGHIIGKARAPMMVIMRVKNHHKIKCDIKHAADERIRLEELRRQVLSGEGNKIAYLDTEQELVLPEIGFQLLQTYHEQIKHWGWICNINAQRSGSFTKNLKLLHRRPFGLTLLAVPCILGINLSDQDLTEFLEQLAETDGSSTMAPSVLRILNFKACRGAIMFGDSLLPSECSLIVEELMETSLCFQCAHGRPTTVPLVNLDALHKQLAKLELQNGGSNNTWHRLRRYEPTLKRAELRLSLAKGHCG